VLREVYWAFTQTVAEDPVMVLILASMVVAVFYQPKQRNALRTSPEQAEHGYDAHADARAPK
jgi:hypothetical protein